MRKEILFQNGYSRSVAILIVLLLLSFQTAVAQTEDESSKDGAKPRAVYAEIEMTLVEGGVSCPPSLLAVIFNPDTFRVNDEDSFYKAIEWWSEHKAGESWSETYQRDSSPKRRYTPENSPIPIKINDKGLLNLFLECKITSLHFSSKTNLFTVKLKTPLDSLFIEKSTNIKCIKEMKHHIVVDCWVEPETGMNFQENDKSYVAPTRAESQRFENK